ncbi:MAG TPA: hypothetical protein VES01_00785 [Dermatophilaceae bacterium]|nr:hypothetical protein [Dermatophilaceae bacterium]
MATPQTGPGSRITEALVSDVAVAVLSVLSLLLPWHELSPGYASPVIVAAVLSAVAAMGLPRIVVASGVEPGSAPLSIVRVVLIAPLLIFAGLVMVRGLGGVAGIGPGLFLGSCAALMAGRPRDYAGTSSAPGMGPQLAAVCLTGLAAGWCALDAIQPLRHGWWEPAMWAGAMPALGMCGVLLWMASDLAWREPYAATVTGVYAGVWFLAGLPVSHGWISGRADPHPWPTVAVPVTLDPGLGGSLTLLGAAAILAQGPVSERAWQALHRADSRRWTGLAVSLLTFSAILLAGETLRMVLVLTADTVGLSVDTPLVATLALLDAVCFALVGVCRWLLLHHPPLGRLVTTVGAAATFAGNLYFVTRPGVPIRVETLLLSLSSVAVVVALTAPRSLRDELGPFLPRGQRLLIANQTPEYAGAPPGPWEAPTWPPATGLFDEPQERSSPADRPPP